MKSSTSEPGLTLNMSSSSFFQTMASPKVLECLVCYETYDDQNLCPRMLTCGHSFCTSCLQRLLTVDDKIPCPTCRVEVNVSQDGVVGLPKNFALLTIFDIKPQRQEGESLFDCEVCDDQHPAIVWCFNCDEDMCKDAARFHTRGKASRDHQLISLESATATALCSKHSEPFRLFDEACGHVVCSGCIKLDHQGHNCLSLGEAASKCRQEMQELATKVSARSEVIKTAEARVKQANLDIKKAYEEKEAQIHSLFRKVGFPLFKGPSPPNKSQTLLHVRKRLLACIESVSVWFRSKEGPRNGFVVLAAREMKREPKNERAILLAPFFARSFTLVPRSLFRGSSRSSATGRHVFGR